MFIYLNEFKHITLYKKIIPKYKLFSLPKRTRRGKIDLKDIRHEVREIFINIA